ncbi:MAG: hypothetical protein ACJARE_000845 [Paracoccaceae bacterium]|jgi:hypothetical protein
MVAQISRRCCVRSCTKARRFPSCEAWLAEGNDPDAWQAYFKAFVVPDKPSYQDRFIILSDGGYSSQTGSGMTEHEEAAKAAAA